MQRVVKLFGKDVAKNFVTMATFCDGGEVLLRGALQECQAYANVVQNAGGHALYTFNNSAMFTYPRDEGEQVLHKQFWDMGQASMKRFIDEFLVKVEPTPLGETK